MLNVGIDLERLRNVNSGLGQFCWHLANNLVQEKNSDTTLHYYYPGNYTPAFHAIDHQPGFLDKILGVRNKELQLFHCTHQDSHLFPKKIPTILTIHDLNFLEKYTDAGKREKKLQALQKKIDQAKGLTFISHYTEQLVKQHLQVPAIPAKVIYNGNCLDTAIEASKPKTLNVNEFLFSIGIVNPKKNFHVLLPLVKATGIPLVIAGNNTHSYASDLVQQAKQAGIADKVILLGPVSEQEKLWLYTHCKAFVFPSLAEGFGLPVIEAMSLGKPVFLSDKTSLPEVGGTQAYYWNHFEADYMTSVFTKGLSDFEQSPGKKNESVKWALQFNWQQTARMYLDFYHEVYSH
jgi:glycosyltransferase involved in cell wall biosynthesis